MKNTIAFLTVLAATLCLLSGSFVSKAQAFPKPEIVSTSWVLDFTYNQPKPIAVTDRMGNIRWYWYMSYKVVNNTGNERILAPEFTIATDSGKIMQANKDVPYYVFSEVKKALKNPYVVSPIEVVDTILQGEDYAKESVAIWPAFNHDVDEYSIFVSGLSGESAHVKNPVTQETVLLRRTHMITYKTPGNHVVTPQKQPMIAVQNIEVMR